MEPNYTSSSDLPHATRERESDPFQCGNELFDSARVDPNQRESMEDSKCDSEDCDYDSKMDIEANATDSKNAHTYKCDSAHKYKPRNGYLNFLRDYRRKNKGLSAVDIIRNGAKEWRNLSADRKLKYINGGSDLVDCGLSQTASDACCPPKKKKSACRPKKKKSCRPKKKRSCRPKKKRSCRPKKKSCKPRKRRC